MDVGDKDQIMAVAPVDEQDDVPTDDMPDGVEGAPEGTDVDSVGGDTPPTDGGDGVDDGDTTDITDPTDSVDDGEQEIGVRCVAVAVPHAPTPIGMSVSGPMERMTAAFVATAAPLLCEAAARLSVDLASGSSGSVRPNRGYSG